VRPGADGEGVAVTVRLRVDMVACEGIGQCALVAPGLVELDRWGFPVLVDDRRSAGTAREGSARTDREHDAAARRAVRACPRRALWLEEAARRRDASPADRT